jgi:hypothetical protein
MGSSPGSFFNCGCMNDRATLDIKDFDEESKAATQHIDDLEMFRRSRKTNDIPSLVILMTSMSEL